MAIPLWLGGPGQTDRRQWDCREKMDANVVRMSQGIEEKTAEGLLLWVKLKLPFGNREQCKF